MAFFPALVLGSLSTWFGAIGYVLLLFTPGAWVTFGVPLAIPFWARLLTGAMLSPLVVCFEFYVIRIAGVPFSAATLLLVVLNLPAVYLIWRGRFTFLPLPVATWLVGAAAIVIPVLLILPLLLYPDVRIFSPHGWYHADAVYMFARGDLVLEDPTLAGMTLPYPVWSPLVFNAVTAFLVNSPPVLTYIWGDLAALIVVCGFAAGIAKELGGGTLSQITSGAWLIAGTTPVATLLLAFVPGASRYCCDSRYTSGWVVKFQLFGPMALALGMLMALIYLLVRRGSTTKAFLFVICLLVSGIGLLYPLLFPPACGIVAARAIAPLANREKLAWTGLYPECFQWFGLLLVASLLTFSEVRFLTSGRLVAESPLSLSPINMAVWKIRAAIIVTPLFLAGVFIAGRYCFKANRIGTVTLLGGGLASYVLYLSFHISFYDNEYKFIFAVTMCLFPFAAISVARIWIFWPRSVAAASLAALGLLVIGTFCFHLYRNWPAPWARSPGGHEKDPLLNTAGFYLHLDPSEAWSGVCNAVLERTPSRSVLVLDSSQFYFPGLTARSLYVAARNLTYRGINMHADTLDGDLRGYGRQILEERRGILSDIFQATDSGRRERAMDTILALNRPVAIVAEPRHGALLEWLEHRKTATRLYADNGLSLWLVSGTGAAQR